MDYDTIAYKVENGVIVNVCVVNPSETLEEGLVKRTYPLNVGYKESFGDFYPDGYTEEMYNTNMSVFQSRLMGIKQDMMFEKDTVKSKIDDLDESSESYQNDFTALSDEMDAIEKYLNYIDNFQIQNPLCQQIISFKDL